MPVTGQSTAVDNVAHGSSQPGIRALGTDGTNDQQISTDATGHVQVDVLTAPSTVVTATDLDVRNLTNVDVVTAELSATDNAVLDTIDAVLDTINAKLVTGTDIGDVTINNASGVNAVNIQDGGNTITVDVGTALPAGDNNIGNVDVVTLPAVTISAAQTLATVTTVGTVTTLTGTTSLTPGTAAANLGKAEDAIHASGDVGVMMLAIRDDTCGATSGAEGDYEPLHTDDTGRLWVDPQGNVAHDAADSGNPIKVGARAVSTLATATMVAAADRADNVADLDSQQIVKTLCPFADIKNERIADTAGTSAASTVFTAVASTRNYITNITIYNSSATNGYVDFRDGTAGAILFTAPAPTVGGSVISFNPPLRQPTANTALAYDVSGALTTVYISLVGFQSKA